MIWRDHDHRHSRNPAGSKLGGIGQKTTWHVLELHAHGQALHLAATAVGRNQPRVTAAMADAVAPKRRLPVHNVHARALLTMPATSPFSLMARTRLLGRMKR